MLAIGCFILGALLPAFCSTYPSPWFWILGFGSLPLLWLRWQLVAKLGLCFMLGAAVNFWQLFRIIETQLPLEMDHQVITAQFELVSLVEKNPRSSIFTARMIPVDCEWAGCALISQSKVRLSWYRPSSLLLPGQVWRAKVKLKRPRGFVNPGGFDYQAWLLGQGLIASGYVKGDAELLGKRRNWASVREFVRSRIEQLSGHNTFARFWPALILAERTAITPTDWQVLQNTGTVHLMAISGLHIGLIAMLWHGIGVAIARLCGCWRCQNSSGVSVSYWLPALLSCSAALLYAALAGFSIATTRALLACLLVQFNRVIGWNIPPFRLFLYVLAVVLVWDPFAGVSPGFWLSFWAVICLLLISGWQSSKFHNKKWLPPWVRLQLMLSVALLVPLLALGQPLSATSPLANLVAIPIMSLAVVPLLIAACLLGFVSDFLGALIFLAADWVFSGLWWILVWLSRWQGSVWSPPVAVNLVTLVCITLALILLFMPSAIRVRSLAAILLITALLLPRKPAGEFSLTVMDVGQGLALVLRDGGETLIYDTGPSFSDQFDAGARIVLPFLRQQGIRQIQLVVSHADLDHSGGAASIAGAMKVTSLLLGEPLVKPLTSVAEYCRAGQRWVFGRANIDVLWPPAGQELTGNPASCVLLIQFEVGGKPYNLLFSGDIDAKAEAELVAVLPRQIDLLIAPHHGSASSSSLPFVRRTAPRRVIYSAGYKNSFGHPHGRVRQRYQRVGSQELNTAESGAIQFIWSPAGETLIETRKSHRRLWFW